MMVEETSTQEIAEASAAAATEKRKQEAETPTGVGVKRKKSQKRGSTELFDSDIPYPEGIHGENFEDYGPSGFAAVIDKDTPLAASSQDQEFIIDEDKIKTLKFQRPNQNLPAKRLYTIKAIHRDGRLVQLPFELQIQNNAGGDPEDAIGLRRYQRKGIHLLIDWDNLAPVYCAAWGCWAQAKTDGLFRGFCGERHAKHTLPNMYKDAGAMQTGMLEAGVTTSNTWSV